MVNNPNIRFAGFSDDWEERKLGELLTKNSKKNKGLNVTNVESVSNKTGFTKQTEQFEDYSVASADLSNYYVITEKQFAYNPSRINVGSIAYKAIGDDESVVSPLYVSFSTKKLLNDAYLWNWFKTTSFQSQRARLSEGGVRDTLSFNQLSKMLIKTPTIKEQQKIGYIFSTLDHKIGLEERQIELLKDLKKGLLQKMFPKNGAKVPELRFAGFADDWEERKLGDEVQIVMGQSPNSENYTDDPNDYILVQGNADMKNGRVVPRVWTTQVTKQAEKDDLILSVRAPVGDIGKTDYDVVIGRGVAAIKGNEFIFQNLCKMKSDGYWTRYSTGSTFESINSTDIKEAIISVPAIEEQQQIGSFFKKLDKTIALHQRKLDLLNDLKKGLSQQMFV